MNTNSNGNLPGTVTDHPGVVAQVPTAGSGAGGPDLAYPAVPARQDQPDLATDAKRGRADRKIRALVVAADYLMLGRVKHPDGGESPVHEVIAAEKQQRNKIAQEADQGSKKHQRMPHWLRWIPRFVLYFDFCLLLYFFAGITNVNWRSPLSIALAFAAILAAMVTLLSYGLYAFTGHRLRGHKNHAGTVHADELDRFTRVACIVSGIVIVVIAVLMYLRMRTEVLDALGGSAVLTAEVIAMAIAIVSVAANFLVIAVGALDGSHEVARLERLSAAARRPYARANKMREEAARHADQGG